MYCTACSKLNKKKLQFWDKQSQLKVYLQAFIGTFNCIISRWRCHADRSVDLLTSKISSSYDFSSTLSWALISWWSLCDVVKSSRPGKSLSCFWVEHCPNYQRFLSPKTRSSPATVDYILLSELILPVWTASLASDCLFDCCSLIVWLLNFVVVRWLSLLPRSKKVWTVRGSRRL